MMIDPQNYARKPFKVEAIRATEENLQEIATWCGGTVETLTRGTTERKYVKVPVIRAWSENQTRLFVGNWVLKSDRGWRVFTDTAFHRVFEPVDGSAYLVHSNQESMDLLGR